MQTYLPPFPFISNYLFPYLYTGSSKLEYFPFSYCWAPGLNPVGDHCIDVHPSCSEYPRLIYSSHCIRTLSCLGCSCCWSHLMIVDKVSLTPLCPPDSYHSLLVGSQCWIFILSLTLTSPLIYYRLLYLCGLFFGMDFFLSAHSFALCSCSDTDLEYSVVYTTILFMAAASPLMIASIFLCCLPSASTFLSMNGTINCWLCSDWSPT